MKKKHTLIAVILIVLVAAAAFLAYRIPIKKLENIDMDSDVHIYVYHSYYENKGENEKVNPIDEVTTYLVKKDSEELKNIRSIIGKGNLYRKKKSYIDKISPTGGTDYSIVLNFDNAFIEVRDDGIILIDEKVYGTKRFGKSSNEIFKALFEYVSTLEATTYYNSEQKK